MDGILFSLLQKVNRDRLFLLKGGFFLLAPAMFLIKGSTSAICFFAFAISVFFILSEVKFYLRDRGRQLWSHVALLSVPFLSELLVQFLRGGVSLRDLDGPFRFLCASVILIFISRHNSISLVKHFYFGVLVSAIVTPIFIFVINDSPMQVVSVHQKWIGRWSSYMADPLTLGTFLSAFAGVAISFQPSEKIQLISRLIKTVVFLLAGYILIKTQSRTSWVSLCGMLVAFLVITYWSDKRRLLIWLTLFMALTFSILFVNDMVRSRSVLALKEFFDYFFNDITDTSVGLRLALAKMDLWLAFQSPIYGWEDAMLPSYDEVATALSGVTPLAYQTKLLSGSHNEYLAQLSRLGVLFGSLTIFSLFFYPFFLAKKIINWPSSLASFRSSGILFIVSFAVSSIFIQTLNLKMCATFFAIFCALLFSVNLKQGDDADSS